MQLSLSWDLIILIFFVVIMSYSYIVGQNGTLKIILASYIGMLASNGIGNLMAPYILISQPLVNVLNTTGEQNVVLFKIFGFILLTLLLVLRGSFGVETGYHRSWIVRLGVVTFFGFLSAGLIMSTILVFITGSQGASFLISQAAPVTATTAFVKSLIDFYNIWFAAPAVAFVIFSLLSPPAYTDAPPPS